MKKVINIIKKVWSAIITITFAICCIFALFTVGVTVYRLVAPTPPSKITIWQYKGHDMLYYERDGHFSICHSPECRKCFKVFD